MRLLLAALLVLVSGLSHATELASRVTFPEIWAAISESSPELKAKRLNEEAAETSKNRMALHWLPRLRAEAKAFNSDDPTMNFMNILGERQVTAQDFNPSQLNSPGTHSYTQTTVGAEFPIYEGGQSQAAQKATEKVFEARKLESASAKLSQYSETVGLYGELISLSRQKEILGDLEARADNAIKHYRLGTKVNPVGYSGLLALKSLKNKIAAALNIATSQIKSDKRALELLSGRALPGDGWSDQSSISRFLKVYAPIPQPDPGLSTDAKSKITLAEASQQKIKTEQAKFLPQVGLFAQDALYTGERGSSSGYAAGAYLRWSLGATDIGSAKEARLEASAAQAQAQAVELKDQIQRSAASTSIETLEKTLALLDDNEKLLLEQWSVSEVLFKNGSLTAHQLAEILSKTADVVETKVQTEKSYIFAHVVLLNRSDFDASPERIWSLK